MLSSRPTDSSNLAAENAALRAELARYRAIVEQMSLGVSVYRLEDRDDDHSLRLVALNRALEPLVGIAPADLLGKTLDENFPGLREQGVPQACARVVCSGEPLALEVAYGARSLGASTFTVRVHPLPNDELVVYFGNNAGCKQVELDLTQLNVELEARVSASSAAFERSQGLLRHMLDSSASAIYLKDLEGRFLLVNYQAAALMGRSPEELVGRADHELFPAEYVAAWRAAENEVRRTRARVDQEELAPQPDGMHTFFSSRSPVFDERGEIYAISGISTDITPRIRIEEELRQSQRQLKTIIDSLPIGVMLKAAGDGRFILWNSAAEQLFGAPAEHVVGKTDFELFPQPVAEELWATHQAVLASGQVHHTLEETIQSPQLGPVAASITRIPIIDDYGVPKYMLIITTDLSEQKRIADERAALQAQVIEAQQHALRELSTPLLPLSNRVVLMPIVGAMDSRRAQQVIETLLEGVAANNAEIAIVDITGVQVVDTQVANAFIQSARAVQLLGARVMLTGIRPEVAQTLVQLGVDLQNMLTRGSLQAGIAYAFKR